MKWDGVYYIFNVSIYIYIYHSQSCIDKVVPRGEEKSMTQGIIG